MIGRNNEADLDCFWFFESGNRGSWSDTSVSADIPVFDANVVLFCEKLQTFAPVVFGNKTVSK